MSVVISSSPCCLVRDLQWAGTSKHKAPRSVGNGATFPASNGLSIPQHTCTRYSAILQHCNESIPCGSGRSLRGAPAERRPLSCRAAVPTSEQLATEENANGESQRLDVSSNCVNPVFRESPQLEQPGGGSAELQVLFLSEGNVCRSVYAQALFNALLRERNLQADFTCASKATRDYNLGEEPDSRAVQVAEELQLELPDGARATLFQPSVDIVAYDLALVMDKFVAADVLKEVSVFDTISPGARYSAKVRRLGDFCTNRKVEDIDDPLYGNMGGPDELENLRSAYADISAACEGLLEQLLEVRQKLAEGESFKEGVRNWLHGMETLDWMVPPMLQKRT